MALDVPDYVIRQMREEEIPDVLDLWRETGLSEGTYSINTWFALDPEGFFVAVSDTGEVLGACAGVLQNQDLAFVGLYAVKSNFQRRGIGTRIWNAVMERIGDRNAGVNPVPEQLQNYRDKAGFPVQVPWCSAVCVSRELPPVTTELPGIEVQPLHSGDVLLEDVVAYDADVNGCSWDKLLALMCDQRDSATLVAVQPEDGNKVCGYGHIKANIKGDALVGPLYADTEGVAEAILRSLVEVFPLAGTRGVTLMIWDQNGEAVKMCERLGFEVSPGVARLYRSAEPSAKFRKIFAQHNLNFSVF